MPAVVDTSAGNSTPPDPLRDKVVPPLRSANRCVAAPTWLRVSGFGFQVSGFKFRVPGSGFRVSSFGFRVLDSEFRVPGSGFRVPGFEISEFGFEISSFEISSFNISGCGCTATVWSHTKRPAVTGRSHASAANWSKSISCAAAGGDSSGAVVLCTVAGAGGGPGGLGFGIWGVGFEVRDLR